MADGWRARLRAAGSRWAMPGWIALVLTISSLIGSTQRIMNAIHEGWKFMDTPTGGKVALVGSVAWITIVVMWPAIKEWAYKLIGYESKPRPKPINERLETVEARLGGVESTAKYIDAKKRLEE